MEILVEDIPEEGLDITATEKDVWLCAVVKEALEGVSNAEIGANLSLHLTRVGGNVNVDGDVSILSHPVCDRCLAPFEDKETVHVHEVLAPLYESERQRKLEKEIEVELVAEDMEFSYYEGDRIDLAEVVREHIALERPMRHLCSELCKGLCQRCGKNLNEGPCGCPQPEHKGSFDVLKGFNVNRKNKKKKGVRNGSPKK